MTYRVTFRGSTLERTINLRASPEKLYFDEYRTPELVQDYRGGHHNYDGLKGYLIEKACKKLFGKGSYWFGNFDHLDWGQVVGKDGYTLTPQVVISINETKTNRRIV